MNNNKIYNAMGFVEALIAIIITGVASVVLMQMAGSTLKEAVQNDKIDRMTMYAVEGANITSEIFTKNQKVLLGELGVIPSGSENCYIPVSSDNGNTWDFLKDMTDKYRKLDSANFISSWILNRGYIKGQIGNLNAALIKDENDNPTQYFRIACLSKLENQGFVRVQIFVAHMPSSGTITNNTEIKDYRYFTTVKIGDD